MKKYFYGRLVVTSIITSAIPITLGFLTLSTPSWARHKKSTVAGALAEVFNEATIKVPVDNEVCFSPEGHCDIRLWKFMQTANKSLDVAIFDVTHPKIAHEIAVASKRIPVRVLVDRRQAKGPHSLVDMLVKAGVNVRIGVQRGIMHNKFTIVDSTRLETGSFNYTDGATEKNNENQIYLSTKSVVETYQNRFNVIWERGTPADSALAQRKSR